MCLLPFAVAAEFDSDDLPAASTWYLHIDFEEMRTSDAGKGLYEWIDAEIMEEIHEETGIDMYAETDRLTAFSAGEDGAILVMEGGFSQDTHDKLLAFAAMAGDFEQMESRGQTFYFVGDNDEEGDDEDDGDHDIEIDGIGDSGYFSLAIDDRILMTGSQRQMEELLANRGRIAGGQSHEDALFVLTAERSLILGGMNTDDIGDAGDGFDSNILRNTKQVAFMIADVAGKLAIEAQLVTTEPEVATSLASIVRGLLALAVFDDDMEPQVAEFLRGTRVDVEEERLKISVALSPEAVRAALEEA